VTLQLCTLQGDALAALSAEDQQLLEQLVASAPRLVTGSSIRLHLRDHLRLLPTGCIGCGLQTPHAAAMRPDDMLTRCPPHARRVDQLLLEGLREGTVTEVAGETASGKSQVLPTSLGGGGGCRTCASVS
jgi:hypothetical protein